MSAALALAVVLLTAACASGATKSSTRPPVGGPLELRPIVLTSISPGGPGPGCTNPKNIGFVAPPNQTVMIWAPNHDGCVFVGPVLFSTPRVANVEWGLSPAGSVYVDVQLLRQDVARFGAAVRSARSREIGLVLLGQVLSFHQGDLDQPRALRGDIEVAGGLARTSSLIKEVAQALRAPLRKEQPAAAPAG